MKKKYLSLLTLILAVGICLTTISAPAETDDEIPPCPEDNLIENCDFETGEEWPEEWPEENNISWDTDSQDRRFLRLTADPDEQVMIYKWFDISEYTGQTMELTVAARTEVEPGPELWHDARIMMNLKDNKFPWRGDNVSPSPSDLNLPDSTDGEWKVQKTTFEIPEGAKSLELMPALAHAESGNFDMLMISLHPVK